MSSLNALLALCFGDNRADVLLTARQHVALWDKWLAPISVDNPVGEDPGYDDDFQRMREEVNTLSGADTGLICERAEKLLTTGCKDVRVATYYLWARLHRDGEAGLAEGLILLAGLLDRYGETLLPLRANSRKAALEWLAGSRVLDSLSRYPEVDKPEFERLLAALALFEQAVSAWDENSRPQVGALYHALTVRLTQSGGPDALVPQNSSPQDSSPVNSASAMLPTLKNIQSGRELLDQAKALAGYLRDQPQGWLSGNRLMKCLRWDTVHQLPPMDASGRTRLVPPRSEYRAQLKRLYVQQSWSELLELADRVFAEGVNHFWLDVQWYLCQALAKSGQPYVLWADVMTLDLRILLERLNGLESLAYDDGTPFADEVTLAWIHQQVRDTSGEWQPESATVPEPGDNAILALETEALAQADAEGIDVALRWLQSRTGIATQRQQWLLRLLMARVAEQYGKNEMALHLLDELNARADTLTVSQWETDLVFETHARQLRLLRLKAQRNESNKVVLVQQMDVLLARLVALDPVRAAVLCV
ncbi:MAG: type VI secretion system protein TssA [Serratia fonticola]